MLPEDFPPTAGSARDAAILAAARAGLLEVEWVPVTTSYGEHTAIFQVCRDGVKLGGVRLAGSATVCQQVADILGASLGTPRLNDEAWIQSTKIAVQTISPNTTDTPTMVQHSSMIDAAASGMTGLVMPVGKPWCLSKNLTTIKAALYGWQSEVKVPGVTLRPSPATPGVWVVQELSTAHNPGYVDYSSSIWLVARQCVVDGVARDLWDILRDPSLAPLASHEGALPFVRQPGVPVASAAA